MRRLWVRQVTRGFAVAAAVAAALALGGAAVGSGATGASRLEVRDGTLSLVKAPGESTRLTLGGSGSDWTAGDAGNADFDEFSPRQPRWPGILPSPGAGCAQPDRSGDFGCAGVSRIDVSGGDEPDLLQVESGAGLPVRLAGNGGRDALLASGAGEAEIDGGPGDDSLAIDRGSVRGGPGDDAIEIRFTEARRGRRPVFAPTRIDCGPGRDVLIYGTHNGQRPPATVDAASCPPVITPLRRYQPSFPGDYRQVRLPASRRLRMKILQTPEALHGVIDAKHGAPACTRAKRFRVAAGKTLRVTLRLTAVAVARSRSRRMSGSYCPLRLRASDPQGDRVEEFLSFYIRPATGGSRDRRPRGRSRTPR